MLDRSGSHIREQGVSSCVVIYCVYACMHAFVVYVFVYVHARTLCVYFLVAILTHSCYFRTGTFANLCWPPAARRFLSLLQEAT